MTIALTNHGWPAKTVKSGQEIVAVTAGQSVKVETTPGGSELLDVACPAGKAWSVRVQVEIIETDA